MKLDVWLETTDMPVGALERADDKSLRFTYSATADTPISVSLPLRHEPYSDAACVAYFGNLLFEGEELERIVAVHGLDRDDIGHLLYHLGADCPGAVSITPEGTGPGKRPGNFPDDYEEINEGHLQSIVASLHRHGRLPEKERDPSPVAGVQPKIAIVYHEGQFYRPREGSRAPTTHILKVSPRKDRNLAQYEAALLNFASSIKIAAAETEYLPFNADGEAIGAVLSTRFDRQVSGAMISRLHCEDFCQALGLSKSLKYERGAGREDLRFSAQAVGQLALSAKVPAKFQVDFFTQTLFNLAIGNTDNHGKNGSILYRGTHGELAPLYDVVPITIDPDYTHELAFRIGGATWTEDVTVPCLEALMRDLGFVRPKFNDRWEKLLRRIADRGVPYFEKHGGKRLADGIAAQLSVLQVATGLDLNIPQRDYFPRPVRDR